MNFGDKLRQLRKSRFLSQEKLAKALGISQSAITQYETGLREPDFNQIKQIADYFGVAFSSLMPSDQNIDDEFIRQTADSLHANPKLGMLFDRARYLSEKDLDVVLSVIGAIQKERGDADE